MPSLPPTITCRELIARYETLLFDAYGVLVTHTEALPLAKDLIDHLNQIDKSYFIVTNGSSSSPERTAQRYRDFGLEISSQQVISSGSLASGWIKQESLQNSRFMILGPPSCHFMVEEFGGTIVPLDADDFDVLIIGNQDGFPFREAIDHVISVLFRAFDQGKNIPLLLPNPDLIFPGSNSTYFMTGGMIAHIIEAALSIRYPQNTPQFVRLGKPYAPIFNEAKRRAQSESLVMVGDQMVTDIKGALDADMAAVLIGTGLCRIDDPDLYKEYMPTYRMLNLSLA